MSLQQLKMRSIGSGLPPESRTQCSTNEGYKNEETIQNQGQD